ncbi:MAG: radical SAM protein, partial [Candidatus Edwardsbacteria bacterium]
NGLRGDLMDEELILKLKTAGAYYLTFAVETASPRIQKMLKKNIDLLKMKRMIELTDRHRLLADGYFMLGFPSETLKEISQTVDFALNSKLHTAAFFEVVPFPRTELYEIAEKSFPKIKQKIMEGNNPFSKWSYYREVTGINLNQIQKRVWLKFYFNLRRLTRFFQLMPKKVFFDFILWRHFLIQLSWRVKDRLS